MIKLQKLLKEKNDKIQIPGVGVMSYDGLKKDVNKKVQDLLQDTRLRKRKATKDKIEKVKKHNY